jgi:diguanylate cyclase (GGDEF)-like protein/PAS domain S-box-containing protein
LTQIPFHHRIRFRVTVTLSLLLLITAAGSAYLSIETARQGFEDLIQRQFHATMDTAENFIHFVGETAVLWSRHLADEKEANDYLNKGDLKALAPHLQSHAKQIAADSIIMLDNNGQVMADSNQSLPVGISLSSLRIVRETLSRQQPLTEVQDLNGNFVIYASAAMNNLDNDKVLGMVLIGYTINNQFLQKIKKNTAVELAIVRRRALVASTLPPEYVDNPIPFLQYQLLLNDDDRVAPARLGEADYFFAARPLEVMSQNMNGSLLLAHPRAPLTLIEEQVYRKITLFTLAGFILILLVGLRLSGRLTQPIQQLSRLTQRITHGGYDRRIEIQTGDEFEDLAYHFNQMMERVTEKDRELRENNITLEQKIEQRTKELNQAVDALQKSQSRLSTAMRVASLGSWEWDLIENRWQCSADTCRIFGCECESRKERPSPCMACVHPEDLHKIRQNREKAQRGEYPDSLDYTVLTSEGEKRHIHEQILLTFNSQGQPIKAIGTVQDITGRKQAEALIERQARFDALTELPNRRHLLERMEEGLARAKRHGNTGALMFLDLDHFKTINDSLGHQVGDQLLIEVASRLRDSVRREDLVARHGGDEFVVLLSEFSDDPELTASHAQRIADKIQSALCAPYLISGHELHISPSLGISLFPTADEDVHDILKHADTAMYKAKEEGRNAVRFYRPSMQTKADERLALEKDLRLALEREEFSLHYQPQVDHKGSLIGLEALLRWHHPHRGMVQPSTFIPVAETSGQIIPIGEWVMESACRQLRQWADRGLAREIQYISINVSPRQFHLQDFPEQVEQVLYNTGISPSRLKLELTEGIMIKKLSDTINKMRRLKELGVSIAIDDFGTGYSSLTYLKKLPITQLKIDRSFVQDIALDANDAAIVETIISMARHLGLDVVAEGVETSEQLEFLLSRGCHTFQGYYFSRPLDLAALSNWLQGRSVPPTSGKADHIKLVKSSH